MVKLLRLLVQCCLCRWRRWFWLGRKRFSPASGGTGGGGNGFDSPTAATNGTANLGGGGGGNGGTGGKGVVIIRHADTYKQATVLTVGTVIQSGGYYIYTFNDSGTIGWS
jgi:hypothetical protein